jgi:hypothetical protein
MTIKDLIAAIAPYTVVPFLTEVLPNLMKMR